MVSSTESGVLETVGFIPPVWEVQEAPPHSSLDCVFPESMGGGHFLRGEPAISVARLAPLLPSVLGTPGRACSDAPGATPEQEACAATE